MSDYNNGSLNEPCLRLPYGFGEEVASVELGDGTGYVRLVDYEKVAGENAKLRELLADTLIDPRDYCAKYGIDYDGWDSANDDIDRRLRELGIGV